MARAQTEESTTRAAIAELLERRSRAVLTGDEDAFMATVAHPESAFGRRQRRLFRAMRSVPFDSYRLSVNWPRYGDLARPSDVARYPDADEVVIPVTEERYRIKGFDPEAAAEDLYYTYALEDGVWRIAEDTDLDDLAFYSTRHLWDFGPVEKERSRHFLLLSHPCARNRCARLIEGFLSLAERGLERVARYWNVPWQERVVVLVPATERELGRMIQATFDLTNFVAFAYSTVDGRRGGDYTGHRIITNKEALQGRSASTILTIMAHELLHIATRDSAGRFVPIFVDEGFADYVGNDADPESLAYFNSQVASGGFTGLLPRDFEFTVGTGNEIYGAYQRSQSSVGFFIDRWGLRKFVRFYVRLGRRNIVPGTARYHLDLALRQTIGVGYDAFEEAWADSIAAS